MVEGLLARKPREVELYYHGKPITPTQIFETFYNGLQVLIDHNYFHQTKRLDEDPARREIIRQRSVAYNKIWQTTTADLAVSARIRFDDLSDKAYSIKPRTNFDPAGIFKKPNIAYLTDEAGNTAILREARIHNQDIAFPKMHQFFGNKFDRAATKVFYDEKATALAAPGQNSHVIYLPEPQLLAAMERLYADTKIPRVTPEIQVIGNDATNLWYLRDMRQIASDISLTAEKLGAYTGILRSLGLMEIVDARQLVHYYYSENGAIGNYDFDFIAHSTNQKLIRHREQHDIARSITLEGQLHNVFDVPESFAREAIRTSDKIVEKNEKLGINPLTLFSVIKPNIELTAFNKLAVGDLY